MLLTIILIFVFKTLLCFYIITHVKFDLVIRLAILTMCLYKYIALSLLLLLSIFNLVLYKLIFLYRINITFFYMSNLYILNEVFTNGLNYNTINLITVLSVLCGIFVIISKNPIVSVLFLIGLFLNIAGYLMILGLSFIGLSYLLVYVGAVSILFLFILMLINVRISELTTDNSNSVPSGIAIGIFFNITLYKLLPYNIEIKDLSNLENDAFLTKSDITGTVSNYFSIFYKNDLSFVSANLWDGALSESSHITSIGNILYTNYPLWLIITSLILLLAMVGAIIITIKQ